MHTRKHITWSHAHKKTYNLILCRLVYMFPCVYVIRLYVSFMTSGYMFPYVYEIRLYVSLCVWHKIICFLVCMTSGYMFSCVYDIRLYVSLCVWHQVICFLVCMRSGYMFPCVYITWSHTHKETYNLISYTQGNI
jgi:hypothetical protein